MHLDATEADWHQLMGRFILKRVWIWSDARGFISVLGLPAEKFIQMMDLFN